MEFGTKRFQPGDYRQVCVTMISDRALGRSKTLTLIEDELWDVERDERVGFVVNLSRN
ncbi:MAG: hypothetical protein KGL39_49540 [Patescibacteria group bacterium]|nr:hypothetical protein [Patescibacteria group bacterium]